jgi:hypothetical protein
LKIVAPETVTAEKHTRRRKRVSYRLLEAGEPAATRIEGAAIFTSTSSIGFLVQACVT